MLVDYAKIVAPYVRHVHLSDAHGAAGEGVQVDEGEIDWDALMLACRTGTPAPFGMRTVSQSLVALAYVRA